MYIFRKKFFRTIPISYSNFQRIFTAAPINHLVKICRRGLASKHSNHRDFVSEECKQSDGLSVMCSISPRGRLHVGHYFGVIKNCVELQNAGHDVTVCIADLHALNFTQNKTMLKINILETVATLISCGLNPSKTTIFQQSRLYEHCQLDWILQCLMDRGEPGKLSRHSAELAMFKEPSLGLYAAPVLHCADVLLHKSILIPAGIHWKQQVEMTCHVASLFNQKYGQYFSLPKALINADFSSNIRSFRRPVEKMSRSEADPKGRIELLDLPEVITEKCKKAVTDFTSAVYFDSDKRPGVSNLMALHSLVSGKDYISIQIKNSNIQTAQYKYVVADALNEHLEQIRKRTDELLLDRSCILSVLESGAKRSKTKAEATMSEVHDRIGFKPSGIIYSTLHSRTHAFKTNAMETSPKQQDANRKLIFSGIQPTGVLHLGNYFGAVRQWVQLQDAGDDVMVCVVDQHAITLPQQRDLLHRNILLMAASIIACGVDPSRSLLFQQSLAPQHAQLNAVLRSVAHVALLQRQAHFKDKLSTLKHEPSLGLFAYPVLQAADILLYRASHVPVGDDQKQHIQVTRQIARQFNTRYGDVFLLPRAIILDDTLARLKSLCQPSKKMSKSEVNAQSRIEILDSPDSIIEKCSNAATGRFSGPIHYDPDKYPGLSNIMAIHSIVTGDSFDSITNSFSSMDLTRYKRVVADAVIEYLKPIRKRAHVLLRDKSGLLMVLETGGQRARERADHTLHDVHVRLGVLL